MATITQRIKNKARRIGRKARRVAAWEWIRVKPKTKLIWQCLGITFLVCMHLFPGLAKLIADQQFRLGLLNSPFIPNAAVPYFMWAVPIGCLLIAAALFVGFFWRWALSIGLHALRYWLLACTMYILAILTVAEYRPCECVGIAEWMGWWVQLAVNLLLLYIAWLLIRNLRPQRYLLQQMEDAPPPITAERVLTQFNSKPV